MVAGLLVSIWQGFFLFGIKIFCSWFVNFISMVIPSIMNMIVMVNWGIKIIFYAHLSISHIDPATNPICYLNIQLGHNRGNKGLDDWYHWMNESLYWWFYMFVCKNWCGIDGENVQISHYMDIENRWMIWLMKRWK